jgi:hypothetical protein
MVREDQEHAGASNPAQANWRPAKTKKSARRTTGFEGKLEACAGRRNGTPCKRREAKQTVRRRERVKWIRISVH